MFFNIDLLGNSVSVFNPMGRDYMEVLWFLRLCLIEIVRVENASRWGWRDMPQLVSICSQHAIRRNSISWISASTKERHFSVLQSLTSVGSQDHMDVLFSRYRWTMEGSPIDCLGRDLELYDRETEERNRRKQTSREEPESMHVFLAVQSWLWLKINIF